MIDLKKLKKGDVLFEARFDDRKVTVYPVPVLSAGPLMVKLAMPTYFGRTAEVCRFFVEANYSHRLNRVGTTKEKAVRALLASMPRASVFMQRIANERKNIKQAEANRRIVQRFLNRMK